MALRKNDLWLGIMSFLMLGLTLATAYYGMQNAKTSQAKDTVEKDLNELQKKFDGKMQSYSTLSGTNARLNSELKSARDEIDSAAIKLQKYQQMATVTNSNGPDTEQDRIAAKIAEKNLQDLQRRTRDAELFAEAIRQKLRAGDNNDAMQVLTNLVKENQRLAADLKARPSQQAANQQAANQQAANEQASRQPKPKDSETGERVVREPLERVRKRDEQQVAANDDSESSGQNDGTEAINLKPPRDEDEQLADSENRNQSGRARVLGEKKMQEEEGKQSGKPADERPSLNDDALVRQIEAEIASEVAAARLKDRRQDQQEIESLQGVVDQLTDTLARRENLLREQAEFIERIKPAKSVVRPVSREVDIVPSDDLARVDRRETQMRELEVNEGFTSGAETLMRDNANRAESRSVIKTDNTFDDTTAISGDYSELDPRGVIIKEEIIPYRP